MKSGYCFDCDTSDDFDRICDKHIAERFHKECLARAKAFDKPSLLASVKEWLSEGKKSRSTFIQKLKEGVTKYAVVCLDYLRRFCSLSLLR